MMECYMDQVGVVRSRLLVNSPESIEVARRRLASCWIDFENLAGAPMGRGRFFLVVSFFSASKSTGSVVTIAVSRRSVAWR